MATTSNSGKFVTGVSVAAVAAVLLNFLPYVRTRGAYHGDGFEVIGFPFVFRRFGGFEGIYEFNIAFRRGCLHLTVNRTKGLSSVCPVHRVTMTRERVDIVGIGASIKRDEEYPYAGYPEYGGCIPPQPMWARVYACPECQRGYREAHGRKAAKL